MTFGVHTRYVTFDHLSMLERIDLHNADNIKISITGLKIMSQHWHSSASGRSRYPKLDAILIESSCLISNNKTRIANEP